MRARYLDPAEVPAVLRRGCPGYTGRKFVAVVAESVELLGAYWSGGSRSVYRAVELATGRTESPAAAIADPPAFGGPASAPAVEIPAGWVIVEHQQGPSACVVFHVRPDCVAALLPAPAGAGALPAAAAVVLWVSRRYIASARRSEAARDYGCARVAYDSGLTVLCRLGLVNPRGALTIAGKNAAAAMIEPHRAKLGQRAPDVPPAEAPAIAAEG
jgi:hypothetical protein